MIAEIEDFLAKLILMGFTLLSSSVLFCVIAVTLISADLQRGIPDISNQTIILIGFIGLFIVIATIYLVWKIAGTTIGMLQTIKEDKAKVKK